MGLIDLITAIADAIRSKTGKEDKLTLEQMATEIESIEVGSDELALSIIERTATSISSNKVTQVGAYALSCCKSLKIVDLPECTTVKTYGFTQSKELVTVNLPKATTIEASSFRHCSELVNVNIPNMATLGGSAFEGCAINKIDVGKVSQIAANTFNSCSKLETVILRLTSKTCTLSNVNAFNGTLIAKGTGYIYVPQALIEQYKVATNWISFAEQFRAIEDYPEICGGVTE